MNKSRMLLWSGAASLVLWIGQASAEQQSIAFLLPSGVRVEIVEAAFNKALFKVSKCGVHAPACLINGHVPFGNDSELPKTYTKSITVSYQGQSYSLDVSDMYDAWGDRPLEVKGVIRYFGGKCFDAKNCQLRGVFSDAAGSFVAEWRIVGGVSVRTVLTNSNDVVKLFMQHIDPPEFN